MKKIIIAAFLMAGSFGIVNAQAKEKAKTTPSVTATTTKVKTTKTTPATTTTDVQKSTVRPTLKKDGTPDKRFKENKVTTKTTTVGPLKKDGTADMRYKKNKVEKK